MSGVPAPGLSEGLSSGLSPGPVKGCSTPQPRLISYLVRVLPELRHFHLVFDAPWLRRAVWPVEAHPLLAGERQTVLDHVGQRRVRAGCGDEVRVGDDGHNPDATLGLSAASTGLGALPSACPARDHAPSFRGPTGTRPRRLRAMRYPAGP